MAAIEDVLLVPGGERGICQDLEPWSRGLRSGGVQKESGYTEKANSSKERQNFGSCGERHLNAETRPNSRLALESVGPLSSEQQLCRPTYFIINLSSSCRETVNLMLLLNNNDSNYLRYDFVCFIPVA